jgi:rhamnosyltransferase
MSGHAAGLPPRESDVCAIVVTYHPDAGLAEGIGRIMRQVGGLVIVDNGSSDAQIRVLHELAANPSITLQLNPANLGVARALNIGIEQALARGYAWVLLLDQDSSATPGMVRELLAAWNAHPAREMLAVIGSGFRDLNKEATPEGQFPNSDLCPDSKLWDEVDNVITSGSLIPLSAHAVVGPFREEFFIDHVDMEYCFRARAKGLRVIKTRKTLMSHTIGAYTQHRFLWKKKWTTNHSPDRRYYLARNDTVMLREYGNYRLGLWRLKSFRRCLQVCKRIALFEESKRAKIIAVAQGWWDGIRGNMGPRGERRSKSAA